MRLICGFLHLNERPAEAERLDRMATAMVKNRLQPCTHRHIDGSLAFAVLDFAQSPAREKQFLDLPKGPSGLSLAADIRLDEPSTENDDGCLIELLEQKDTDGIHQAIGDYAFAAWDPKHKSLLCARDSMGIRPFFFAHRPGNIFVFASLPSGLHASGFVERTLDQTFFINEILLNHCSATQSLFLGVERLAPGSWLRVTQSGIKKGTHWRLNSEMAGSCKATPEDAAVHLGELTKEAVRCRLPTQGPVAAHLSGGIDSASISILAAQALRAEGRRLLAFSLVPSTVSNIAQSDKNPYIDAVLQQEPNIVWNPMSVDDSLAYLLPSMDSDQPLPDDPADPDVRAFMQASEQGAQIFLSGWGGDEGASFNHRGGLAEALLNGQWRYLARELQILSIQSQQPRFRVAWSEVAPYLLSPSVLAFVRKLRGRHSVVPTINTERAYLRSAITQGITIQRPTLGPNGKRNRLRLLTNPGLTRRVEHWAILGTRFGLAAAFPLLDRRIVEYAFSLPTSLFLREGWRRRVFRDAMTGILPDTVRLKPSKVDSTLDTPNIAEHREKLIERLNRFKTHERIAHLFDLNFIEDNLQSLHSRKKAAMSNDEIQKASIILRTFRYAAYIEQHH